MRGRGLTPGGIGGLVFAAILVIGVVGGLVVVGWSVGQLGTPSALEAALRAEGVVPSDARLVAFHDHSEASDGSSGCVLTDTSVTRFDHGSVTATVGLTGATVREVRNPLAVRITGESSEVDCPFRPAEGADLFAGMARAAARTASAAEWREVDPRVQHLLERR